MVKSVPFNKSLTIALSPSPFIYFLAKTKKAMYVQLASLYELLQDRGKLPLAD